MARRNKLTKFSEVLSFPNVVENFDPTNDILDLNENETIELKGEWKSKFFKNEHPLVLELACGRGEYTLALSRAYPENNYLGVDIKGARIWKGAQTALHENLTNAGFLRCKIEKINNFFEAGEVDEIWITFPDPFPSKQNRRLTAGPFLERYKTIIKKGGLVHLKTDDTALYEFSMETLQQTPGVKIIYNNDDIYSGELAFPELIHKTYYELLHMGKGKTIKYVRFTIN
ncbi:MAG: tRNA (guanosine(46)-N7)-methyltransferase TrmB [Saprospiraceae bacterium]|nr:tRNA (guanosine(46)-N7)-methyltransferase TrmB [Saprospiraceae bacterium]